MRDIEKRLHQLRVDSGKTKEELATFLGITVRSYSRYETGERLPDIQSLIALSDYYGCSLDYIVVANKGRYAYKKVLPREEVFCYQDITDKGFNGKLAHGLITEVYNSMPYHELVTVTGNDKIKYIPKKELASLIRKLSEILFN